MALMLSFEPFEPLPLEGDDAEGWEAVLAALGVDASALFELESAVLVDISVVIGILVEVGDAEDLDVVGVTLVSSDSVVVNKKL
ncbi:hypothetical protein ColTof4_00894 [Colletotrichum tofieldiae]|nr:hypothetical protein ColTof3_08114 [Colletotrichum tofieldiae]GKT68471.1 hypothetical protein ColTof4_00894 [Colletotrichum tofieldiae]GKT90509.1 hypothetical protein Ct61P_08359 [Colletotrichum tofieldiae]